jgi:hypothetical protein
MVGSEPAIPAYGAHDRTSYWATGSFPEGDVAIQVQQTVHLRFRGLSRSSSPGNLQSVDEIYRAENDLGHLAYRRLTMKTFITALTLTTLIAGVTVANADQQATGAAVDYALSNRMTAPSAYASARVAGHSIPRQGGSDFQLQGR